MKKSLLFILFLALCSLSAQDKVDQPPPKVTVEQVEQELQDAQKEFEEAKKIFNPWYSGPLLTGSGNTFPPGHIGFQAYLYVTDNYAKYSSSGSKESIPDILNIIPIFSAFTGLNQRMDIAMDIQWIYNHQSGESGSGFGDMDASLGFALLKETPFVPALKFSITEFFPTGRYENLSPTKNGLDSTGAGTYATRLGLSLSKVVLWIKQHPMSFRVSVNITLPSTVHVDGFNTYGGGFGTHGTVSPGKTFSGNFGSEYSFNQNWVFANDIVYKYTSNTSFRGNLGKTSTGDTASVGGSFSDQLSLDPAIEYNPSPNLNFICGLWFTVWGRNSSAFVTGIASVYFSF